MAAKEERRQKQQQKGAKPNADGVSSSAEPGAEEGGVAGGVDEVAAALQEVEAVLFKCVVCSVCCGCSRPRNSAFLFLSRPCVLSPDT